MLINNVILYDTLLRIKYCRRNKFFKDILSDVSNVDSIANFADFKEKIQEIIKKNIFIANVRYSAAAYYYGYYSAFREYSGIRKSLIPLFSHMEHGMANIDSNVDKLSSMITSYCSHTSHRKKELHAISSDIIYFAIGPYIHYSTKYYDAIKEEKIKKKLGKTLLVFPFHTCEGETNGKDDIYGFVNTIYSKYAMYFDTIMVCMYWYDVNSPVVSKYKENGAQIVSAGFRGDEHFIKRLKTIISLADAVVMDEVGTQLGFSLYMGKVVYLEKSQIRFDDPLYKLNEKKFIDSFYTKDLHFTVEQKANQRILYEQFWGEKNIKTKEEAFAILTSLEEIMEMSNYSVKNFFNKHMPFVYLSKLKKIKDEFSTLKCSLIEDALG